MNKTQRTIPNNNGAAAAASQKSEIEEGLTARGLSEALAKRQARTADLAGLQEVLAFFDRNRPSLKKPVGALRSMLEDPERWGFERTAAGWKAPKEVNGRPRESPEDRDKRIAAERAAEDRLYIAAGKKPPQREGPCDR